MTTRDVAAITLEALAVWWIANGLAGLCSSLLTWRHDAAETGGMVSGFTAFVVWRMSRGTGFWNAASQGAMDDTVVYWVAARGQVGVVATKLVLGLLLVSGPERMKSVVSRVRREFSYQIVDEPKDNVQSEKDRGA